MAACSTSRQSGQPVLGRFGFSFRPLDQTPFFRSGAGAMVVTMRWPHSHRRKSRRQLRVAAFPPGYATPLLSRQCQCQLLDGYRLMRRVAAKQLRWASIATPALRRLRRRAWCPDAGRRLKAGDIAHAQLRDTVAELSVDTIAGIQQHGCRCKTSLQRPANLLQSDLWLGLEPHVVRNPSLATSVRVIGPCFR